jgi:hypothetical protein
LGRGNNYFHFMRIGDDQCFVEFEFEEAIPEHLQGGTDTACSVAVSCGDFAGSVNSVWFSREDIDWFLSDLQQFEASRSGSVSLNNMSFLSDANPLAFGVIAADASGHLLVRGTLIKSRYLNDTFQPLKISVSFALDAGMLGSVLRDFQKLFTFNPQRI